MGCRHSRLVSVAIDAGERTRTIVAEMAARPDGAGASQLAEFDETERLHGCGHVFILHCSIKQLAADAVLIPELWKPGTDDLPCMD